MKSVKFKMHKKSDKSIAAAVKPSLVDRFGRTMDYLRISVTDRCNLMCRYCAPNLPVRINKMKQLNFEEMYRLVKIGVGLGVKKVRLTGGEPLVRKGIVDFINELNKIKDLDDISLTTNGTLVPSLGKGLKNAGLRRINISLDTLSREKFHELTGADLFSQVWEGIMLAEQLSFSPIKINTVVMRSYNDNEIEQLANLSKRYPFHIRFIEYMPIGTQPDLAQKYFMAISEIKGRLRRLGKLLPVEKNRRDGPALLYQYAGAPGKIGFIGSMSSHFCQSCNRLRLTSAGHLRPCLLADDKIDTLDHIRNGASDEDLEQLFLQAVAQKRQEHRLSFTCSKQVHSQMVSIGG